MDKLQKQLIDTYFRKRTIAAEQDGTNARTLQEMDYMNKHGYNVGELNSVEEVLLNPSLYHERYFDGDEAMIILLQRPELIEQVNPDKISAYRRADLLTKHPQYFDKLNKKRDIKGWYLTKVLENQPQLVTRFSKEELAEIVDMNIVSILIAHPEIYKYFDINRLSDFYQAELLQHQPNLASVMDLSKMGSNYIARLLIMYPYLKDQYFSQVRFMNSDIITILQQQPQLMDKFDYNAMRDWDVMDIIKSVPDITNYLTNEKIKELGAFRFQKAIIENPTIIQNKKIQQIANTLLDHYDKADIIFNAPSTVDYFDLNLMDSYDISRFIKKNPKLITNPAIQQQLPKFRSYEIDILLKDRPKLAKYFKKHQNYNG